MTWAPGERMLLIRTLLWLGRTSTGDRAELRLSPEEDEAWSKVAAAAEICSPLRCSFHREGTCFIARARRAADSAHVVIVNHSLLLSDVVTGNQVLPEYRHLIVDEAHHLEDEATAQLSRRITAREIARRLGDLADAGAAGGLGLLAEATGALVHVASDETEGRRSTGDDSIADESRWSGSATASIGCSRCSARLRGSRPGAVTAGRSRYGSRAPCVLSRSGPRSTFSGARSAAIWSSFSARWPS